MLARDSRTRYRIGVAGLFVLFLWVALAAWAIAPIAFGWRPVVITSGSMGSAIGAGDVVVVEPHDGTLLGPGNVVTFDDGTGLLTHRIIEVTAEGLLITKGDGNVVADSAPIDPSAVVGVGRILVPAVGLPVAWMANGSWFAATLWALVMAGALWCARWAFRPPIQLLGHRGAIYPWARGGVANAS